MGKSCIQATGSPHSRSLTRFPWHEATESIATSPLDGMLHYSPLQGYPKQNVAGTDLNMWVERDNVVQSLASNETTQWQGPALKPPTFRSHVQCTNHFTTTPRKK